VLDTPKDALVVDQGRPGYQNRAIHVISLSLSLSPSLSRALSLSDRIGVRKTEKIWESIRAALFFITLGYLLLSLLLSA